MTKPMVSTLDAPALDAFSKGIGRPTAGIEFRSIYGMCKADI